MFIVLGDPCNLLRWIDQELSYFSEMKKLRPKES